MLQFPGIIIGVVLFGLAGGLVAMGGCVLAGASLVVVGLAYPACGTMAALAFVAITNRNSLGA